MAEQQVLPEWCLFLATGSRVCKQGSFSKRIEIAKLGETYLCTKCGCCKKLGDAPNNTIWYGDVFVCSHSICRLYLRKALTFKAIKCKPLPLGVIFRGDPAIKMTWLMCISIYIYTFYYIYIYISHISIYIAYWNRRRHWQYKHQRR